MKKLRKWQIIYAICCLVYMGWVIHAGRNEFDRINNQYRRIVAQLDKDRLRSAAVEELTVECRRASKGRTDLGTDTCSSWPPVLVESKEKEIEVRLLRERKRGIIKVTLFYTGFVAIFLFAPAILIYLLIVAIILLSRNIKIVR